MHVRSAGFSSNLEYAAKGAKGDPKPPMYKLALIFVVIVASCEDSTPVEVRVAPSSSTPVPVPVPVASSVAPPRRPTLRHFVARTDERCEVYSVAGDEVSPAERVPCPPDLEVGERIRVAGKTCFRDGSPERQRPVVCPGPLLLRELRDAGADASTP